MLLNRLNQCLFSSHVLIKNKEKVKKFRIKIYAIMPHFNEKDQRFSGGEKRNKDYDKNSRRFFQAVSSEVRFTLIKY